MDLIGLRGADDPSLRTFVQREGFALLSKDDDFRQLGLLRGAPPKAVVVAIGNSGNAAVFELLATHRDRIAAFMSDDDESVLVLPRGDPATA